MAPRFVELADLRAETLVRGWPVRMSMSMPQVGDLNNFCSVDMLPLSVSSHFSALSLPGRNCTSLLMLACLMFLMREAILRTHASRALRSQIA